MKRLWQYVKRHRARYLLGCFYLLVTATLTMLIPYLLKRAVDLLAARGDLSTVGLYALAIVAVASLLAVIRTLSRAVIFNVGRDIEYELRNDLFSHLERLSASYYQRQQVGDLMSRLINDITALRLLLGVGFLNLINTPMYYAYAVSIMLTIDAKLTLAALAPYPLLFLLVKRSSRQLMERSLKVQEGLAAMSSRVQENLSGIHVVKAYVCEGIEAARFAQLNKEFKEQSLALARIRGAIIPLMRAVGALGVLVVLWFGGYRVIIGKLSLGDLVGFIGYLHVLAWPTMALGWMLTVFQRGKAALTRLDEIFAAQPEIVEPREGDGAGALVVGRDRGGGEIAVCGVSFAYGNGGRKPALRDVSFTIPAGATVAIVGRTGSGKSTIASLLVRMFDPSSGSIELDGWDLRKLSLRELRRAVALVPQDPFLFSRSIRDNVAFGLTGLCPAELERRVWRAIEIAAIDSEIRDLPQGLDTVIGERGITLSGGQKQRLTLARALVVEPRVLVLDDALSSVDARTERRIIEQLAAPAESRSVVVISNRLSMVQDADLIVVMDGGRVVETGGHEELVRRGGHYVALFQEQALVEELAAI